jgi:hypothetical protein
MRKSAINFVNRLKDQLLQFPAIVNSLEKREPSFVEKVLQWIEACEQVFTTYNISEVAELAGLRSKIIATRFAEDKHISIRKTQLKAASEVLYSLQVTVLNAVRPVELKIEECRELVKQLLLIVSQAKALQYDCDRPFDDLINNVWDFIITNDQLKAGAIKLRTNLQVDDIRLLLAEEIELEDF